LPAARVKRRSRVGGDTAKQAARVRKRRPRVLGVHCRFKTIC
jgi:hypothetical protein